MKQTRWGARFEFDLEPGEFEDMVMGGGRTASPVRLELSYHEGLMKRSEFSDPLAFPGVSVKVTGRRELEVSEREEACGCGHQQRFVYPSVGWTRLVDVPPWLLPLVRVHAPVWWLALLEGVDRSAPTL